MVSRLTDQKGFDLVAYVLEEMLSSRNVQIAVLGTGEPRYENMFSYFMQRFPDKLHAVIGYSEERAHQIYASCDAFLMPSLFEPCGLSQMMAMRYGPVPIVRETGGLKDTVEPYNEYTHTGTGFSFSNYNAQEMLHVIEYAQQTFANDKESWHGIMRRDMEQNFSWGASARKYEQLYDGLLQ
jgi:starch synthase